MKDSENMFHAVVCGAGGRMGGRIIHAVEQTSGLILSAGVEKPGHPVLKKGLAQYLGLPELKAPVVSDLALAIDQADVIIDFTSPESSMKHLQIASDTKKDLVVGTTGFDTGQRAKFEKAGRDIAICLSPNMSVGVNLLFSLVSQVAKILSKEYDPEIIEIHHRLKKDAPSGTAMQLAHILAQAKGWDLDKTGIYGRKGIIGPRHIEELGIHSIRTGDVVGEHTVIFGGPGERIELIHRAHSRDTFAYGAVKAALFIVEAKPGLYDMQDILGLKG
jgi:4-hydroxy-tetrahydrodipicolinate reductase